MAFRVRTRDDLCVDGSEPDGLRSEGYGLGGWKRDVERSRASAACGARESRSSIGRPGATSEIEAGRDAATQEPPTPRGPSGQPGPRESGSAGASGVPDSSAEACPAPISQSRPPASVEGASIRVFCISGGHMDAHTPSATCAEKAKSASKAAKMREPDLMVPGLAARRGKSVAVTVQNHQNSMLHAWFHRVEGMRVTEHRAGVDAG